MAPFETFTIAAFAIAPLVVAPFASATFPPPNPLTSMAVTDMC
jgi:hypothetical protein